MLPATDAYRKPHMPPSLSGRVLPDQARAQPRFLYLHGFASSPESRKARFFAACLAGEGIAVQIPALDGGDFANLTLSGQLAIVERLAGDDEVILVGSSMGGYLAALHAARNARVRGLILLAPAFGFLTLWRRRMGAHGVERWRREGSLPVFHYGLNRETPLRFGLMHDAEQYEPCPAFHAPALIFHGNHDDTVPVEGSVEYARQHPNVQLVQMDAGHELTEVLDPIWQHSKPFLQKVLAPI